MSREQSTASRRKPLLRRVLAQPEGEVLAIGLGLLVTYGAIVCLCRLRSPRLFHEMWTMTVSHILGGRAAGLSIGYAHGLPHGLVLTANMLIETFMVCISYPLFVFSYTKLVVIPPLEDAIRRARQAAQAHRKAVTRFGVPGLFLFVWFPFWMTGPVVGSIIGFLIGLPLWINLSSVLAGTYVAILCWGAFLRHLTERLERLGPYVPFAMVSVILLLALAIHIRHVFSRPSVSEEE